MKFVVFYLQFINSLEGLGMFFSSAALIRRLRRYTATITVHDCATFSGNHVESKIDVEFFRVK